MSSVRSGAVGTVRCKERRSYTVRHLPRLLAELSQTDRLCFLLTDISFLESKATTVSVFDLANDLSRAIDVIPREDPYHKTLRLLEEALHRNIHFIARHTQDYPQALFQCLWNSCWWYDCPQAAEHYEVPEEGWKEPPPWEQSGQKVHQLVEEWRVQKGAQREGFLWVRSVRPPPTSLTASRHRVFEGHEHSVTSAVFSRDGKRIFTGSGDHTLRVWDVTDGVPIALMQGHTDWVNCVAVSPDGRLIASCSGAHPWYEDFAVRIWDAERFSPVRTLIGHSGPVHSVAFSPDGRAIATGSGGIHFQDYTVRVWDVESGAQVLCLYGHEDEVSCVAYSPDGRKLATASQDYTIRIWDIATGQQLHCLRGHTDYVNCVAFSPDGNRIVSGSGGAGGMRVLEPRDYTARVWDVVTGRELRSIHGHESIVRCVAYSPDGTRIAGGGGYGEMPIRIWDSETGKLTCCLTGHERGVNSLSYSPDGRRIAGAASDNTVRIWDVADSAEPLKPCGHASDVFALAFSCDGELIASGSGWLTGADNSIRVWRSRTGCEEACLEGHEHGILSIVFSSDGRRIASSSFDETVRVWDLERRRELACIRKAGRKPFKERKPRLTCHGWAYEVEPVHGVSFFGEHGLVADGIMFDAETGRVLREYGVEKNDGVADPEKGPRAQSPAFEAESHGKEVVIKDSTEGNRTVAWFPGDMSGLCSHPSGLTWAASRGGHLYMLTLEMT